MQRILFFIRKHWLGITVALLFQASGLLSINDFGSTIDEWATLEAGRQNLKVIGSLFQPGPLGPWFDQELPGYSFPLDTMLALAEKAIPWGKPWDYYSNTIRLLRLTGSALTLFFLYMIAYTVSQSRRVAFFSALTLALFPQFIAHSQNNPKDQPATFTFTLAMFLVVKLVIFGGWRRAISAGIGWGLALVTRFLSVLILPVTAPWVFIYHRRTLKTYWRLYACFFSLGLLSAFLFWPWIWSEPVSKLLWASKHVLRFKFNIPEVYLGEIYRSTDLPWHYFIATFLASTPVPYLFFAAWSLALALPDYRLQTNLRSAGTLAALWCLVPLCVEAGSSSRYNALRHFMLIFPGFCFLAGCGVEVFIQNITVFFRRWLNAVKCAAVAVGIPVLFYITTFGQILVMHPHEGAFLNEATNPNNSVSAATPSKPA